MLVWLCASRRARARARRARGTRTRTHHKRGRRARAWRAHTVRFSAPSVPHQMRWCLIALVTRSLAKERGDVSDLVEPGSAETLFKISDIADEELRYFDLVEPAYGERFSSSSSRLVLAGRGGYGAANPADETWNIAIVESGPSNRAHPESKVVIYDRGFSSNGFMLRSC